MAQYYAIRTGCYNDELYHYGVKGMKWGVRKAVSNAKGYIKKKRIQKGDAKIRSGEYWKQRDQLDFDYKSNELKIKRMQSSKRFKRVKDVVFNMKMDALETRLDRDNAENEYMIAKGKAIKDPAYKQTGEFRKIKRDAYSAYASDICEAILEGYYSF